ncbi:MAG: hypothetical protein BGO55_00800 [Sphingobacteriales bacterium 50-39]|nr:MAG: hypothetical protein BGO55_00800 [Sphingobacteriales bacterium 50-39]
MEEVEGMSKLINSEVQAIRDIKNRYLYLYMKFIMQMTFKNLRLKNMKVLLFISTFCLVASAPGQTTPRTTPSFVLTPSGFRDASDSSNDYLIISIPGQKKADLYKSVLLYAQKKFVNPKNVISEVQDESVTLNGFAVDAIGRNALHLFNIDYTINFEFKDEKIRIQAPSFKLTCTSTGHLQYLELVSNNTLDGSYLGIWNSHRKLKSERAKRDLEAFFETFLTQVRASFETKKEW